MSQGVSGKQGGMPFAQRTGIALFNKSYLFIKS